MKHKWLFLLTLAVNLSLLLLVFTYRLGAPFHYLILLGSHIGLFFLNIKASKFYWQVTTLGVVHIIVTFCVHKQSDWLWYNRYFFESDPEGHLVSVIGEYVGVFLAIVMLVFSLVYFYIKRRKSLQNCQTKQNVYNTIIENKKEP